MADISFERLSFSAEWYQEEANLVRKFLFNFYPFDGSVELFDLRAHKTFLKRVRVPNLSEKCVYLGAKVNVFGRQMLLTDYEDDWTRKKLSSQRQMSFGLIPSKNLRKLSEMIEILCTNGFSLSNCGMFELNRNDSIEVIEQILESNGDTELCDMLSMGPAVAISLIGSDAINRLNKLISGPEATIVDDKVQFGSGALTESIYSVNSNEAVTKANEYFFSKFSHLRIFALFRNTTFCIIKPHAMLEGKTGAIMSEITKNGFQIRAMKMFNLPRENCEEFYEVYNGVTAAFSRMVIELSSGPFLAMEIGHEEENKHPYEEFRKLCGPIDPDIARQIRPKTIRAKFGVNPIQNAVHCTDLEEDCTLEVEYFFKILLRCN